MAPRIRAFDWAVNSAGPIASWPRELKVLVELALGSQQAMCVAAGPELTMIYNDAFSALGRSLDVLGVPLRSALGRHSEKLASVIDEVMAGQPRVIADRHFDLPWREERPEGWFTFSLVPVRGADESVLALLASVVETTDAVTAQQVLRDSEARQAFLLKVADTLRPIADPLAIQEEATRLLGEYLHADRTYYSTVDNARGLVVVRREYNPKGVPTMIGDHTFAMARPILDVMRQGRPFVAEDVHADPRFGELLPAYDARSIRAFVRAPLIRDGVLVGSLGVVDVEPRRWTRAEVSLLNDVAERTWSAIERARVEADLRESERWQRALVEGVPQLVWRGMDGGRWTWSSPQWTEFTGQPEAESHGFGWLRPVHPDDREPVREIWSHALGHGAFEAHYRLRHAADGAYRWFHTRASPVRDESGAIVEWLGTSTDVHELRTLEQRQTVLLHELQHRVRNTLGVVRAIARRTGETSDSVEDFAAHLQGRLDALARTQMVLTSTPGGRVDLEHLVREELRAQAAAETQLELVGEPVGLSSEAAEVLALAVHELATNALKYGALAQSGGHVRIAWDTVQEDEEPWLRLRWTESGVRVISGAPRREGFGAELIRRRVPYELGGRSALDFRPGGLHAFLEFPLREGESMLETHAPALPPEAAQPICCASAPLSGRAEPSFGSSPRGRFLKTVNSPLPSSEGPEVQRPCGASEPSTPVS